MLDHAQYELAGKWTVILLGTDDGTKLLSRENRIQGSDRGEFRTVKADPKLLKGWSWAEF